jgi:hypothetical protein
MAMTLDQWQERLQSHFMQLASARAYSDFPLFALEHDLTDDELEEITRLLHAQLVDGWKLGRHWLVWVVYATELGYDYDGDEYWSSFEQRTPGWRQTVTSTRRDQLRTWFTKFQTTYNGVKPSGPWAEWFSIIAWPITHAILPKYLQWQFARTLYELRYQLAHLETIRPAAVGALLATNAWDSSSRFREFLEQQELTGRIVLALLSDRMLEGDSPIYPPTLERLVADLEEVQSTRQWLGETRRLVADRLKGAARAHGQTLFYRETDRDAGSSAARTPPRIRPTLLLRRSSASTWSVVIDIPSFAGAARSQPSLSSALRSSRCKIAGTGDVWLPSGWLLSGSRRRVLKRWPGSGAPLVAFERSDADLSQWVAHETRLSTGPTWLCRLGRDGLAKEIAGRIARPGRKYILLSEAEITSRHPFLATCKLDCEGIHAALLTLPETISFEAARILQQWGLQVSRTVRVWPAGLPARGFDGEGRSEWLTSEAPCFGIVHDHPVDSYSLRLDNGEELTLRPSAVGAPVFVKIAPLLAGRHTLSVKARQTLAAGVAPSPPAEGVVILDVREPDPWNPGTTSHSGLAVVLDSDTTNLDGFWEGNVGVNVLGPAGHHVTCTISLHAANGKELLSEQVGSFELPVTPADWTRKFSPIVADDRRTWTYLEAASGRFVVRGDELGEYALRLERDVKPLRWVCRNTQRITTVRLVDDTGGDQIPECRFFSFANPTAPTILDTGSMLAGFEVPTPGGLFEATLGRFGDAVTVSLPSSGRGFADLMIEPDLRALAGESAPVTNILEAIKRWGDARILGPLVQIRRNRIAQRLVARLYARLCGEQWAQAESDYLAGNHSNYSKQALERAVGGPHSFAIVLGREYDRMDEGTIPGKLWFASVAARYKICSEPGICEFALQFASHPHELPPVPQAVLAGWLQDLKARGVLLRGARLVALLAASKDAGPLGNIFPRWKW